MMIMICIMKNVNGSQFIRYDQLPDFVDGLEAPLRIPKPNHLLLVAMDLPICEDDRMHCVDILDGLTKYFLGTLDAPASAGTDGPIDIKKDRPKDYHPLTTTLQRQREYYLGRIGLKGFRINIERCRIERQSREPIFGRAMIEELIELDELGTPALVSYHNQDLDPNSVTKTLLKQERERTISDTSSSCSFGARSLC
jgi:hypothetical protein